MAKFNTTANRGLKTGKPALTGSAVPNRRTHTGGTGYSKDAKTELYTLGVNLFAGGEKTFHESGANRDARFNGLVQQLAVTEPEWTLGFLTWLRDEGNIRTASVMGSVNAIFARLQAKLAGEGSGPNWNRHFASLVPQRLDEVPEAFAIWRTQFPDVGIPIALKRGAGDATRRLLNEYSYMKYGRADGNWTVSDVIEMAHVKPFAGNEDLFGQV